MPHWEGTFSWEPDLSRDYVVQRMSVDCMQRLLDVVVELEHKERDVYS